MSLASEPDVQNRILEAGQGAISLSFSESSIRLIVRLAAEDVGEGELAHGLRGRLDEFLVAVAERRAPQAGQALDVALALVVIEIDALAAIEDERPDLAVSGEIGVGMDHRLDVADGHVAQCCHAAFLLRK